ncbi:cytochrome P450 [Whalleya microplaca]|nr:cytochrome P450 [Whalleya microplaca]
MFPVSNFVAPHLRHFELALMFIAVLGHAMSMFKDTSGLYDRAHSYFGYTRQPYALQVAGQKIIIVTNPKQVADIFKDDHNFSFDPFIDLVYRGVGNVSEAANTILWRKPSEGFVSLHPNPKQNVLVHTGNALLHKQILTPGSMYDLLGKVLTYIDQGMHWDTFFPTSVISETHEAKVVSLHRWCRDVLIEAQTRVFFGPYLHELQPNYTTIFDQWDVNSWMITYQYPTFLCKAATVPREKLVKSWTAYLDAPRERRAGGVAFVNELEDEMRHAGLGSEDCARVLMIILWGINSNVQMTAFWMMINILLNESLVAAIREEIKPLVTVLASKGTSLNQSDLPENFRSHLIQSCPLLNSLFNEVIRFYSTGCSVRQTIKPVRIDGKHVPVGTKILLPQRQLLVAPEVFGQDANIVDPQRFLKRKELDRHEYYRPFGGGITMCSGKTVGRYEVLSFLVFALSRYDFKVVPEGSTAMDGTKGMCIPRIDLKKPSLGVSKQVEGDDMILVLRKREAFT